MNKTPFLSFDKDSVAPDQTLSPACSSGMSHGLRIGRDLSYMSTQVSMTWIGLGLIDLSFYSYLSRVNA
jgi:hypothetical protein